MEDESHPDYMKADHVKRRYQARAKRQRIAELEKIHAKGESKKSDDQKIRETIEPIHFVG